MDWTEITISVDAFDLDKASAIASMTVPYGIYIEDYRTLEQDAEEMAHEELIDEQLLEKDRTTGLIHVYISPQENPQEAIGFLRERFHAEDIDYEIKTSICKNKDWENNWKVYFKPVPIGERLLIRPVWVDDYNADGRIVLNLEPGVAFGTGTHSTTSLSIKALENVITPEKTVLDIGCGSGILSVASVLLGAKSAQGVDIDSLAVKTARKNAELNNINPQKCSFIEGNLADKISGKFDVIVANIVADVIIEFSADVAKYMNPNAVFLTSGIIDIRENDVLKAFEKHGFKVQKRHEENNWLCFECKLK
ncbi:MAG TPA: 50S ribosomal protein L11 methyltransferase [Clostridia bacterium]|nr:50S ribosomal protein L11 methyltransferase [Clostridia bacterium]